MEFILLLVAFVLGFGCKLINMPPLIGYLVAGFCLHALGYSSNPQLEEIANLGITIMLFTIGLKLNIKDLIKAEMWLSSILHGLSWLVASGALIIVLIAFSLPFFTGLDWTQAALVAFALSFSSTVCVVKILEESGERNTRHGKIAIGILVMQDIFAVLFLVASTGKLPSIYALLLFLLIPCMPILRKLLEKAGHGELLPLSGFIFALGGYYLFELVGVKGDLGALIIGMLLAPSSKATELSKSLLSFKDLFLIGFFLTIGLSGLPTIEMTLIALLITVTLPLKYALFFFILTKLKLRVRTAFLTSLVMSNFSEFGLIVINVAVGIGLLSKEWLIIMAMSMSFSFVITSLLYKHSHDTYTRFKDKLKGFESTGVLSEDQYPCMKNAEVLVVGMGRVGKGALSALHKKLDDRVWGMDADSEKVSSMPELKQNTIVGDGENIDLWENLDTSNIKLVLLALPSIEDSSNITTQLRSSDYTGQIAAIARYEDEVEPLLSKGVDKVFNFFTDAGYGFADESIELLQSQSRSKI